jgi:proteasome lid subunit RPN8/RPN11
VLAALCAHLADAYPEEGCGVILEGGQGTRVLPLRNAYAGDRRCGFAFEPRQWLQACLAADGAGERVSWVFHSHVDGPASLSEQDRAGAAPGGQLLVPGARQLVVSVHAGRATEIRAYCCKDGEFLEEWRSTLR